MTSQSVTRLRLVPVQPPSRPAGLIARLFARLAALDRHHREMRYLREMDDRLLRDIGVTRADIEAEMRRRPDWSGLLPRR